MMTSLPAIKNQFLLAYALDQIVKKACGVELVYAQVTDQQPKYPYISYSFITAEQETTADWLGANRLIIISLQIDCHSDNALTASELARELREALMSPIYRDYLKKADIVPQTISETQNRTILQDVNYDQCFGFDADFMVRAGVEHTEAELSLASADLSDQAIESIVVLGTTEGNGKTTNIEISKGEK